MTKLCKWGKYRCLTKEPNCLRFDSMETPLKRAHKENRSAISRREWQYSYNTDKFMSHDLWVMLYFNSRPSILNLKNETLWVK